MLIVFIGLIVLINGMLGGIGGWFGMFELKLEMLLGWLFVFLVFLIGVFWNEVIVVGEFIGLKIVVNEFVVYF